MRNKPLPLLVSAAILGALTILWSQEFQITEISIGTNGVARLQHEANTNTYYLLLRGNELNAIHSPADVALGTNQFGQLTDPTNALSQTAAFYRVLGVPLNQPFDLDGDGIDDVFELRHRLFLNPLDKFDAFLDFDGDGFSNLREYQDSSDPAVNNPRAFQVAETSPAPGETGVNLVRETIVRFNGSVVPDTITTNSFYITANGQRVRGNLKVSSTEHFATLFYSEPLPSSTEITATVVGDLIMGRNGLALDANGDLNPGGTGTFSFRTLPLSRIPGTVVFGYVRNSYTTEPIAGATIRVDAFPEANAVTDENGRFELIDMPAPVFFVHVDGTTATNVPAGYLYPNVGKAFHSVPGQATQINHHGHVFDVHLPLMALGDVKALSSSQATDVGFGAAGLQTLTNLFPDVDPSLFNLLKVRFEPGSAFDQDTLAIANQAVVIPVPPDRLPSPLPPGVNPSLVISIQAIGATSFDTPAQLTFPNLNGFPPGSKATLWSFDHDAGHFIPIGNMTVSIDGLTITTDPGVGVPAPGWHFVSDPRNWSAGDGTPGTDEGGDPNVVVHFVSPGTHIRSYAFGPPPGPPAQAGSHNHDTQPQRRVTTRREGGTDALISAQMENDIKDFTYVLQPGDDPVEVDISVLPLETIESNVRRFEKDALLAAKVTVNDVIQFANGNTFTTHTIHLIYVYVDYSDDLQDSELKFPDLLTGLTQSRQFDSELAGLPAPQFVIEGLHAADFGSQPDQLTFSPSALGERIAQLQVRAVLDGEEETSVSGMTLAGNGMKPQEMAFNKAGLIAVLQELTRSNDVHQLTIKPTGSNPDATFTIGFRNEVTPPLPLTATESQIFFALSGLNGIGAGDVMVTSGKDEDGLDVFNIEYAGSLDHSGESLFPFTDAGGQVTLSPFIRESRMSPEERAMIDTPAERTAIANAVEAKVRSLLGTLQTAMPIVEASAQPEKIQLTYRTVGLGLFGTALSGVGPGQNDNLGFQDLLRERSLFRQGQFLYRLDQLLNVNPAAETLIFPDTFFDTSATGDLAAPSNNPPSLLVDGLTKTILHESGHTLGAVHVYKPPSILNVNGATGINDVMRSGFDSSVSSVMVQAGMSKDLFKLALNADYTREEALNTLFYLTAHFNPAPFDADGSDPNSQRPLDGAFLLLSSASAPLVTSNLDSGIVLVDGAGGATGVLPLTLSNPGTQPVILNSVSLENPTNGFAVTPVMPGTALSNGASVAFNVVFDPLSGGTAQNVLRVMSTDLNAPLQQFHITGFGLSPNPVFSASFEKRSRNFGGIELGHSATNVLTIVNLGLSNLTFTLVASSRSFDFGLSGTEGVQQMLAFGQSLQIPLTYSPTRIGLARQLFNFITNDPDQPAANFTIVGTGIGAGGLQLADTDWGSDYVAVDQNNFTERLQSNTDGNFMTALPTFTPFTISVFDPSSGYLASGGGVSGPAAAFRGLTSGLKWSASTSADTDGDGLPDDIEHAIGTAINNRDTDGDGMDDFAEIMQGLNPADGIGAPIGIIGSLDLPGIGHDVELATFLDPQGGETELAFVALSAGFNGLLIADVSNPQSPVTIALAPTPGAGVDVEVDVARRKAVLATAAGIYAFDVSNPANPTLVTSVPGTTASTLELVDDLIYANSVAGMRVLDAVTLDEIEIIPVAAAQLEYHNGFLYAGGNLRVVDVRIPHSPVLGGTAVLDSAPTDFFAGNGLVVATTFDGLRLLDVTNPANPLRLDDGDPFADCYGVALNGSGLALVARDNFGLTIFDITTPTQVTAVRQINTGRCRDVRLHEGIAVTVGFRGVSSTLGTLTTVNYLSFDGAGQSPTVSLTPNVVDVAPGTPGIQVFEGTPIPLQVAASDDLQVRRVELLVNGIVTEVDTSFPFSFTRIIPPIMGEARTLTLQAKASDMALNEAATSPLVIEILPDTTPPMLADTQPTEGSTVFAPGAISLTFNEIMDATVLNLGAVSLVGLGPNGVLGGGDDTVLALTGIEPRGLGQRIAITPASTLPPGRFRLTVNTNVLRDLVGNFVSTAPVLNFVVRPPLSIVAASGIPAEAQTPSLNVGQPMVVQTVVDPRLVHVTWTTRDANGNAGTLTLGALEEDVNDSNGTANMRAPVLAASGPVTIFGSGATNITKLLKWDVTSATADVIGQDSQGGQTDDYFPGNGLYVNWHSLQAGHTPFAMQTRELIDLPPGDYEFKFSGHGFGQFANLGKFTISLGTAFNETFQFNGTGEPLSNIVRTITITNPEQARILVQESGGLAFNGGTVDNFRLTRLSNGQVLFEDDFSLPVLDDLFQLQIVPIVTSADMTSSLTDFPNAGMRLNGSGFTEGDFRVDFLGAALTDPNLVGSPDVTVTNSQIALTVPASAQLGPITVTTAGGTSAPVPARLDEILTVAARGTPANLNAGSANIGQVITVRGQGFTMQSDIFLTRVDDNNGSLFRRPASPQTVNSNGTEATFVLPESTITANLSVPGNQSVPGPLLQIVPVLNSAEITVNSFSISVQARLHGFGFVEGASSYKFGNFTITDLSGNMGPNVQSSGKVADVTVFTSTEDWHGRISVTTAGGTSETLSSTLTSVAALAATGVPANPALASINPGQTFVVTGAALSNNTEVICSYLDIAGVQRFVVLNPTSVNSEGTQATFTSTLEMNGVSRLYTPASTNSLTLQVVPVINLITTDANNSRVYFNGAGFVEGAGSYVLGTNAGQTVVDPDTGTATADVLALLGDDNRAVRLPNAPAFGFGQARVTTPAGNSAPHDLKMLNPALQRSLYAVAMDPASGDIFVAAGGANSFVRRLNRSGGMIADFDIPNAGTVDTVGLNVLSEPVTMNTVPVAAGTLLVFNGESNPDSISALDPSNGAQLSVIGLGNNLDVRGGVYDPATDHFFVVYAASPQDRIAEINPTDGSTIRTFTIPTQLAVGGLTIDPATGNFWVASALRRLELVSRVDGSLQQTLDVSDRVLANVLTGLAVDLGGKLLGSSTHGVVWQFDP